MIIDFRAKAAERPRLPITYSVGLHYDKDGNFSVQVNDVADSPEDRKRVARDLMDAALMLDPNAKPSTYCTVCDEPIGAGEEAQPDGSGGICHAIVCPDDGGEESYS